MPNITLALANTAFPADFSGTLDELISEYNANLTATTTTSNLMTGDVSSTSAPVTNVGPWMNPNTRTWYAWDTSLAPDAYSPAIVKLGNTAGTFAITLTAPTLAANRNVKLPDKDGIVAYRDDVYYGSGTQTLTADEDIDWSISTYYSQFYQTTTVAHTHAMTNSVPGQRMVGVIVNTSGSNRQMSFTNVIWEGGVANPTIQTAGQTWIYFFQNIAGTIYGNWKQNFA